MTEISDWFRSLFIPQTLWGEYQKYAAAKRRWKEIVEGK